ncbi:MAG: hypothetical protein FWD39_04515 [Clostridiales bacterium]|nr:hypothetical protein [Clostridiales bacterium]
MKKRILYRSFGHCGYVEDDVLYMEKIKKVAITVKKEDIKEIAIGEMGPVVPRGPLLKFILVFTKEDRFPDDVAALKTVPAIYRSPYKIPYSRKRKKILEEWLSKPIEKYRGSYQGIEWW